MLELRVAAGDVLVTPLRARRHRLDPPSARRDGGGPRGRGRHRHVARPGPGVGGPAFPEGSRAGRSRRGRRVPASQRGLHLDRGPAARAGRRPARQSQAQRAREAAAARGPAAARPRPPPGVKPDISTWGKGVDEELPAQGRAARGPPAAGRSRQPHRELSWGAAEQRDPRVDHRQRRAVGRARGTARRRSSHSRAMSSWRTATGCASTSWSPAPRARPNRRRRSTMIRRQRATASGRGRSAATRPTTPPPSSREVRAEGITPHVAPEHHEAAGLQSRLADAAPSAATSVSQRCRKKVERSSAGGRRSGLAQDALPRRASGLASGPTSSAPPTTCSDGEAAAGARGRMNSRTAAIGRQQPTRPPHRGRADHPGPFPCMLQSSLVMNESPSTASSATC